MEGVAWPVPVPGNNSWSLQGFIFFLVHFLANHKTPDPVRGSLALF